MEYYDQIAAIALGLSLAATCGLRAFLPLLVVSALAAMGKLELADSFSWMASPLALICFGSAVVIEIAGDKFPVVDHFLDSVAVFVKPIAAAVVTASLVTELDPMLTAVIGLVVGGSMAGGVHLMKAKVRLLSSAFTMALANPVLSLIEDILAVVATIMSFLVPVLVVVLMVCGLGGGAWWIWRRSRSVPEEV